MNHGRNSHYLRAINPVQRFKQGVLLGGFGLEEEGWACFCVNRQQRTVHQILKNRGGALMVDVELTRHFLRRPSLWASVPDKQQRFQMRNAVDLIQDELIYSLSGLVLDLHP